MKEENLKLRMAVIAGASHAIKYRDTHLRADTAEVIRHINEQMDDILATVGSEGVAEDSE